MTVTKIYCNSIADIPTGDHFAIIEGGSIHVPGDERSRECPGHGYPASTEYFIRYIAFTVKEEWEAEIRKRMEPPKFGRPEPFKAIVVTVPTIETSVTVKIGA